MSRTQAERDSIYGNNRKRITPEQIERDRQRLLSKDPVAMMLKSFLDSDMQEVEVLSPEPGQTIDGHTFTESDTTDPVKLHQRIYTIAQRCHWLKKDLWVAKHGKGVWLFKSDDARLAAKERWKGEKCQSPKV